MFVVTTRGQTVQPQPASHACNLKGYFSKSNTRGNQSLIYPCPFGKGELDNSKKKKNSLQIQDASTHKDDRERTLPAGILKHKKSYYGK